MWPLSRFEQVFEEILSDRKTDGNFEENWNSLSLIISHWFNNMEKLHHTVTKSYWSAPFGCNQPAFPSLGPSVD